jgi:hypothetical protein
VQGQQQKQKKGKIMDRQEIAELFDDAAAGHADETVVKDDGNYRVARFGTLVVWDDHGEMWDEEFMSEGAAADAIEQQR